MNEDLKRELRKEAAYERLGSRRPRCGLCGEADPVALQGAHPNVTCYECSARMAGRARTEDHHPSGRRNNPFTVAIPGNDHRVLSDLQRDWPERTLRNPNGSPLLTAAAAIRGWLDVLALIVQRTLVHIPSFLEGLDEALRAKLGDRWWEEPEFEGVAL